MTVTLPRQRVLPRLSTPTRDGVALCTDVFLPDTDAPAPTILIRTPYGRHAVFLQSLAVKLSRAGFAVTLQDSRGRYQSGGQFDLRHEQHDGYDTLAWLADQPWCDKRVALVGLSITGHPNFAMALDPPPADITIAALINIMGVVDLHSVFYANGALRLHWALPWCRMMSARNMGRSTWKDADWDRLFRHQPATEALDSVCDPSPLWTFALSSPVRGDRWRDVSIVDRLPELKVPVLHLSGWHDFMLDQVLRAWRAIGQSDAAELQRLIIGPWDHQTIFAAFNTSRPGAPRDESRSLDLMSAVVAWLERLLHGDAGADRREPDPRVLAYVMEDRSWVHADSFPSSATTIDEWYLDSDGRANTSAGDGRLRRDCPIDLNQDTYRFDPADPIPTIGGAIWPFPGARLAPGALDQSSLRDRGDILTFIGPPCDAPLTVLGPVHVELWAASSACDTDFTAKLVDVDPFGVARIVQDGIVRARFRDPDREAWLDAHRPYCFTIDVGAVGHCFKRGHRLRLDISSSNFPKFDRNLNTAAPMHASRASMVATQTVFSGGAMPSKLVLPVLTHIAREEPA